jgi:hypothetical protein
MTRQLLRHRPPRKGRPSDLRNLKKAQARTDPRRAATGRGRVQHEVALQFAIAGWGLLNSQVVMQGAFWRLPYDGRKCNASHYQQVRRAFERFAVRDHRLASRGRPWVWRPKDEIMNYPGGPDEWWWRYKHPFRKSHRHPFRT